MSTFGECAALRIIVAIPIGIAGLVGITGCGGGGGGGSDDGSLTGTFSDSPVEGLGYVSGTRSGETDANGTFHYAAGGARITFSVGDIEIGNGDVAAFMTPVDLVKDEDATAVDEGHAWVTNIARFLQTLDDDGDPANGIRITQAVRDAATGLAVEFGQSITDFENDGVAQAALASLTAMTSAGVRSLVSTADARAHLRGALLARLAGRYTGTFAGDVDDLGYYAGTDPPRYPVSGTWKATVDAAGAATGTITFVSGRRLNFSVPETFQQSGTMSSSGRLYLQGTLNRGYAMYMHGQATAGAVSGNWYLSDRYFDSLFGTGSLSGSADGG